MKPYHFIPLNIIAALPWLIMIVDRLDAAIIGAVMIFAFSAILTYAIHKGTGHDDT